MRSSVWVRVSLLGHALFALAAGGCKSLGGGLSGSDDGRERLVDVAPFDPEAGVLWADKAGAKSDADLKKAHPVFLIDVTVIDGTGAPAKPHQDVLIQKGKIAEIAPTGDIVPPKGTEKIKGTGGTVMPGLVDSLAFASSGGGPLWEPGFVDERRVLEANLYAGVTTMVVGGDPEKLAELRDAIKKGDVLGPQLFLASPILTVKNGYPSALAEHSMMGKLAGGSGGYAREILNPGDAKTKVNELADNEAKYEVVPIVYEQTPAAFPKISQESLRVAIDRTHTRGRKAMVFTGTLEDLTHALSLKADAVFHGVYLEPLDDEKAGKVAAVLAAQQVGFAPGFVELWGQGFAVSGVSYPALGLEKDTAESDTLSAFPTPPKAEKRTGMLWKYAESVGAQLPVAAANVKKLATAKLEGDNRVPFLVATQAAGPGRFPGAAVHRELEFLVKAGVSPVEAVASATGRAATFIREDKADFGVVAVGKRADLVLVEGDVSADITNTQRIKTVIVNGRVVERIPLGKWAEHNAAKTAATPEKVIPTVDEGKPAPGQGGDTKKKKKRKSTGADEDPTPMSDQ